MKRAELHLVPIDSENWERALELSPSPEQEEFVASNTYSLAQAAYSPLMVPLLAVVDDEDVGFAMHDIDPEDGRLWILRLMIDARYQGRGHGGRLLDALVRRLQRAYPGKPIRLGFEPGNEAARGLYLSRGFRETGEVLDGETIYELPGDARVEPGSDAAVAPEGGSPDEVTDVYPARLGRTVILAHDLDSLAKAYRDAFGWTTIFDSDTGSGQRFLHVGPAVRPGEGVWFLAPAGEEGRSRIGAQTGGEPLLVLYVIDLEATVRRAVAAGFEAFGEAGTDATSAWQHVRDPIGNRIVLVRIGV